MSIVFKYVPLSFISASNAIENQLKNTIVFKTVLEEYGEIEPLSELIESTQYGYTASAKETGTHRLLRITDINNGKVNWETVPLCDCEREGKYLLNDGDVLIARTGNNISYLVTDAPKNAVFASYLIRISCNKEKILPEYLFLFLNSYAFWPQILLKQRGALLQNVNAKLMGQLLIPICPIEVQEAIVKNSNHKTNQLINSGVESIIEIFQTKIGVSTELTHQLDLVKQLRQAFLREAMQGRLVPQDPNDEPASVLLEKIKAEKERLIKEKKIKKSMPLPPISEDEIPFEIPDNWVWCRLGEISNTVSTGPFGTMLHKSDYVKDGIPLVNPMNIVDEKIVPSPKMMVDSKTHERLKSYVLKKGDVVIGRRGEMGRCAAVNEKEDGWLCGTGSFFIDLYSEIYRPYFVKTLSSETSKKYLLGSSVGSTMNNLNHRILNSLPIPLPPLSEQQRIVAKLDELMAYCDDLEASIKESQQQNELLLQQVLREALEPKVKLVAQRTW